MSIGTTKENVGSLLDTLYLEMLDLIEQQTACRVNIERLSSAGQLLLAKTRYLQGSQTISQSQMPTENTAEFKALCHVEEKPNIAKVSGVEYALQRHQVNRGEGYIEPMRWFAILAPSCLRAGAEEFKKSIEFVLESANIQRELVAVMENIELMKQTMQQFSNAK